MKSPSKNPDINTPQELKEALDKLITKGCLPLSGNTISKGRVEIVLGFVHGALRGMTNNPAYKDWVDAIDEYEKKLIKEEGSIELVNYRYGNLDKFKEILDHWREPENWDKIPVKDQGSHSGAFGHINILEFSKVADVTRETFLKSEKWAAHRRLLEKFNKDMYEEGALGTSWERKVPGYKIILEELDKKKKLSVNQKGMINKTVFMQEHAGIADNISVDILCRRAPKLKAMFSEYDKRLKERGVTAFQGDAYLDDLKELLKNGDYVLNKDKLMINRVDLCVKLGIKDNIIKITKSLHEAIQAEEKKIFAGYKKGKTKKFFNIYGSPHLNIGACPYSKKHERVFDFEELIEIYGLEFSEKIGTAFIAITTPLKSGYKPYFSTLVTFLKFIASNKYDDDELSNVFNQLKSGSKIDQNEFDFTCLKFRAEVNFFGVVEGVNEASISYTVITKCGNAKLFPIYTFKQNKRQAKRSKDKARKPSLAEAKLNEEKFIGNAIEDAAKARDLEQPLQSKDTKLFTLNVIAERDSRDDLPEDLVECILEISRERLTELKKVMSKVFLDWQKLNQKGRQLISLNEGHKGELIKYFDVYLKNKAKNKWFLDKYFPEDNLENSLINLLLLIKYDNNSIPPISSSDGQFWRRQYRRLGGVETIHSYLNPTQKAVTASLILYLCDSGVNVAVAQMLTLDRIEKSNVPNHTKITGNKDRAKGKNIFDDIPNKSGIDGVVTGAASIKCIAEAVNYTVRNANQSQQAIFTYTNKGVIHNGITEFNLRLEFKRIFKESEYLSKYKLTPSMIRPTVLLKAQLEDPTNAGLIQMMASHESETTTVGYTNKLPYRVQMEEHLSKFQDSLEAVLLMTSSNKNKEDDDEAEAQLARAQKTGLGVFCGNRNIEDNKVDCNEVQDCVCCKQNRMLVVAEADSISDMVIWQKALEEFESKWELEKPDRWAKIWIPWKAFFHVVLNEKMARGKLSKIKKDAIKMADVKMKDKGFVMPEPW